MNNVCAPDGSQADPTFCIDDTMPGDGAFQGEGMQRVAHLTGVPGKARQDRNLAVRGDSAGRDALYDVVNLLVTHLVRRGVSFLRQGEPRLLR